MEHFKMNKLVTNNQYQYGSTLCLKKTSPTILAITRESIVGFS